MGGQATIVDDVHSIESSDLAMQDLMSRINIEHGARSVHWKKVHAVSGT